MSPFARGSAIAFATARSGRNSFDLAPDARHRGIVAKLLEPLGRRQHLQAAFEPSIGGGYRRKASRRDNHQSEHPHATSCPLSFCIDYVQAAKTGNPWGRLVPSNNGMHVSDISGIFRIAVEQFDRNTLRSAQKADFDAGAWRMRFLGELYPLLLEIGGNRVDA